MILKVDYERDTLSDISHFMAGNLDTSIIEYIEDSTDRIQAERVAT